MEHSPLLIRIAMHYYYSPNQWSESSNASDQVHQYLQRAGLITKDQNGMWEGVDPALEAYVSALKSRWCRRLNVPLPVLQWTVPTTTN